MPALDKLKGVPALGHAEGACLHGVMPMGSAVTRCYRTSKKSKTKKGKKGGKGRKK